MDFDSFDTFENYAKEGEFTSNAEPLYFKNWVEPDFYAGLGAKQHLRAAQGDCRGFPHTTITVGYLLKGLKEGWMRHPREKQILAAFPDMLGAA